MNTPRSFFLMTAYQSVDASLSPRIGNHGRGGRSVAPTRPASTSWRRVATRPV
ncbi:MAG: hypothetical protein QOF55_684 [Thermoleophilaceae bacterium]|nr:hypothetical protein [Thermoleophilaceae bacterium]